MFMQQTDLAFFPQHGFKYTVPIPESTVVSLQNRLTDRSQLTIKIDIINPHGCSSSIYSNRLQNPPAADIQIQLAFSSPGVQSPDFVNAAPAWAIIQNNSPQTACIC